MPEASCQMIHPGHPDDPHGEKPCVNPAVGITQMDVRVCGPCAAQQLREGFPVSPYPREEPDWPLVESSGLIPDTELDKIVSWVEAKPERKTGTGMTVWKLATELRALRMLQKESR